VSRGRRGDDALREALDASLDAVTADGSLRAAWERWITWLPFPLPD
jgi:ABC-type amino acid transport substrate-binding protein